MQKRPMEHRADARQSEERLEAALKPYVSPVLVRRERLARVTRGVVIDVS